MKTYRALLIAFVAVLLVTAGWLISERVDAEQIFCIPEYSQPCEIDATLDTTTTTGPAVLIPPAQLERDESGAIILDTENGIYPTPAAPVHTNPGVTG